VTKAEEKLSKKKAKLRRKEERVKKITEAKHKKQTIGGSESQLTRNDHKVKDKADLPVRFKRLVYAACEAGLMTRHRA
jgi:hypothetical protein